jgi:hypothetical protein
VSAPTLQALLPADHVYRDEGTGKHVIAGTFHRINVERFPATLERTVGVFISLRGIAGETGLQVDFVDGASGDVLIRSRSLAVNAPDPETPVEFAVELPPLPLPHAGRYLVRLACDGTSLGEAPVLAGSAA